MIKHMKVLSVCALGLLLVGCSKVSEVYSQGLYESGLFENNFYTNRHDFASKSCTESLSKTINSDQYFNGDNAGDFGTYSPTSDSTKNALLNQFNGTTITRKGLASKYPEVLQYSGKDDSGNAATITLDTTVMNDWRYTNEGQDSKFVGKSFGRTKCLVTTNSAFKDGFLSKLYNGQLYCHGDHMRALVQLDQNGYDAFFPKTLVTGDYFLISLRGGSNYLDSEKVVLRTTELDLRMKFYVASESGYSYTTVLAQDVVVRTDCGGEGVTWFGFKFSDIGIASTAGILGMSLSYENFDDPAAKSSLESCDRSKESTYYWGAMVYEVMFPDSSWK